MIFFLGYIYIERKIKIRYVIATRIYVYCYNVARSTEFTHLMNCVYGNYSLTLFVYNVYSHGSEKQTKMVK